MVLAKLAPLISEGAYHHPLNLLHPLNPHAKSVSNKKAWPLKLRTHTFLISNYFKRIPSAASPRDSSTEGWGRMTLRKSSMVR